MSKTALSFVIAFFCTVLCTVANALDPAIEPLTPQEVSPVGLEEVPQKVSASIQKIASLPGTVTATGGGSVMTIPELPLLQGGLQEYSAARQTCIADQVRAAGFCREETSPDLQNALSGVNLVLAGANSIAINDACSSFSKAVSVAQLGLTGYTATCGLLRKKCNLSCASAAGGLKKILQGLVGNKATCTPGTNPTACPSAMGQLTTLKEQIYAEVKKEASLTDKRSIHSKEKLCDHTYGLLLVSAGASILSLANSLKQGQQCDEDSKGNSSTPAATASTSSEAKKTETATTTTPTVTASPSPASNLPTVAPVGVLNPVLAITPIEPAGVLAKQGNSELRDYLPGGTKAAAAEPPPAHPDVTPPDGKSNFEKMRIRFQELGLDGD